MEQNRLVGMSKNGPLCLKCSSAVIALPSCSVANGDKHISTPKGYCYHANLTYRERGGIRHLQLQLRVFSSNLCVPLLNLDEQLNTTVILIVD